MRGQGIFVFDFCRDACLLYKIIGVWSVVAQLIKKMV